MIELRQVTVAERGETILDRCTAVLPSATITQLVGDRGSGKTTLVRAIAGIQRYSGDISFDGAGVARVFSRLYVCFDNAPVFPFLSGYENVRILLGRPLSPSVIARAAPELADPALLRMPARQLSHGQRHRLHLVAALASGASYLVLDDVFAGVDAPTMTEVAVALTRRAPAATVLITGSREAECRGVTMRRIDLVNGTLLTPNDVVGEIAESASTLSARLD